MRSIPHGHVQAVLGVMRTVGMDALLAALALPRAGPGAGDDRAAAVGPVFEAGHHAGLAGRRRWRRSCSVDDADANDLYAALDWLQQRQGFDASRRSWRWRHLTDGAVVLFDVSSSSYHGRTCPLARRGSVTVDGDKLPSIVYGLLTDGARRPVAVEVYPGNTGDHATVPDQVEKLRARFRLERVVLVGDRGDADPDADRHVARSIPGWAGFPHCAFQLFARWPRHGAFQPSLFDTAHLAEITSAAYPGERLVV